MGWKRFIFTFSSLFFLTFSLSKVASAAVSVTIINYPEKIKIDEPFSLTASVSGLPANQEFKYKVGVATTSTYYGYGQVKKDDTFIGYNDANSCEKAPTKNVDDSGFWNGEVTAKVNRNAKTGDGKLRFKICGPDKTSSSYSVTLTEPDPLPIAEVKNEEIIAETTKTESNEESEISTLITPIPPIDSTPPQPPPKPKTVYQLPATLSAIPVPKIFGTTSAKEATIGAEANTSTKQFPTNYVILAIIAAAGFVIGLVVVPKFLKK